MIVWALFDDGEQSVLNALRERERVQVISVGIQNKESVFYCDLSNFNCIEKLKELPKPDIIVCSPPCESWSIASSMLGGNASWRVKDKEFMLRKRSEYEGTQYKFEKQLKKRILGELCAYNTFKIIEYFKPKLWYIENPWSSRIWLYYNDYLDFRAIDNKAEYLAYDETFPRKATNFMSNIPLDLKVAGKNVKPTCQIGGKNLKCCSGYDTRSRIPLKLISDIFDKFILKLEKGD